MKKILALIRRWRYRLLFQYWFQFYAKRCSTAAEAYNNANTAFFWLGCCMDYREWLEQEYFGGQSGVEDRRV